jgi:hypothetical protein
VCAKQYVVKRERGVVKIVLVAGGVNDPLRGRSKNGANNDLLVSSKSLGLELSSAGWMVDWISPAWPVPIEPRTLRMSGVCAHMDPEVMKSTITRTGHWGSTSWPSQNLHGLTLKASATEYQALPKSVFRIGPVQAQEFPLKC